MAELEYNPDEIEGEEDGQERVSASGPFTAITGF
jgi:hypothetical protein